MKKMFMVVLTAMVVFCGSKAIAGVNVELDLKGAEVDFYHFTFFTPMGCLEFAGVYEGPISGSVFSHDFELAVGVRYEFLVNAKIGENFLNNQAIPERNFSLKIGGHDFAPADFKGLNLAPHGYNLYLRNYVTLQGNGSLLFEQVIGRELTVIAMAFGCDEAVKFFQFSFQQAGTWIQGETWTGENIPQPVEKRFFFETEEFGAYDLVTNFESTSGWGNVTEIPFAITLNLLEQSRVDYENADNNLVSKVKIVIDKEVEQIDNVSVNITGVPFDTNILTVELYGVSGVVRTSTIGSETGPALISPISVSFDFTDADIASEFSLAVKGNSISQGDISVLELPELKLDAGSAIYSAHNFDNSLSSPKLIQYMGEGKCESVSTASVKCKSLTTPGNFTVKGIVTAKSPVTARIILTDGNGATSETSAVDILSGEIQETLEIFSTGKAFIQLQLNEGAGWYTAAVKIINVITAEELRRRVAVVQIVNNLLLD